MAKRSATGGGSATKSKGGSSAGGSKGKPRAPKAEPKPSAAKAKAAEEGAKPQRKPRVAKPPKDPAELAAGAEVVEIADRRPAPAQTPSDPAAEFHMELVCQLDNEELRRKSDEMASAVGRRHEIEAERREYAASTRADLKGLTGQIEQLAEQVNSRTESRPVRCRRVTDPERKKVAVFRMDTQECVDVRDMTEDEAARVREEDAAGARRAVGADVAAAIRQWEEQRKRFVKDGELPPAARRAGKRGAVKKASASAADSRDADDLPPGDFDLSQVPGLSAAQVKGLQLAGFGALASLREAATSDLTAVQGIGPGVAHRVLLYVGENYPEGGMDLGPEPARGEPYIGGEEGLADGGGGNEDGLRGALQDVYDVLATDDEDDQPDADDLGGVVAESGGDDEELAAAGDGFDDLIGGSADDDDGEAVL